MRINNLICLTAMALSPLAISPLANSATEKVSDFALLDQHGEFHQLSRYQDHEAVVLMSHSAVCGQQQAISDFEELKAQYADKPVAFFILNANTSASATDASENILTLIDDTQLVAKTLGLTHSAEVVVLDPQKQNLLYRGPVKGQETQAADVILATLNDQAQTTLISAGTGSVSDDCPLNIQQVAKDQVPNFNQDIVPILEARCASCHREGGIGPFAMDSHAMIRGWAPMIREVVLSKRMPPGQIDPAFNHVFQDVAHLTIEEQQTLVNWIDAGANNTDKKDALAELAVDLPEWQLGEPDIIVDVPAQSVPATGVVDYRYIQIPLDLEEDIWVSAVEFLPSAHDVMHHIIAFSLDTPNFSELELVTQGVGLGAYAPGNQPTIFPENTGYKLSAGGGLFLQMHYTTSGKAAVDKSRIGLYLHKEKPEIAMRGGSAAEFQINIPPHVKESPMTADRKFNKDAYLVSLSPHMHFRGSKVKYTLVYPNGSEEVLLSVPNYQFNWQKNYDYIEPKFVPAGSRLVVDGAFNNSATNPNNPDPSVTVTWGEQSWEEMFFGFYRYFEAGDNAVTMQ